MTLFYPLPLLLLVFLLIIFVHESRSYPTSTHFGCPADDVYNRQLDYPFSTFTNSSVTSSDDKCELCVLTCDEYRGTMISCRGSQPEQPYHVLHIDPKKDGILVVEHPDFYVSDNPCQAYSYFNVTFPISQVLQLKILGGTETYLGCPITTVLSDELPDIENQTCALSMSVVYGPFFPPFEPPAHIPLHCIQFQTFPRNDKGISAPPPEPHDHVKTNAGRRRDTISKPALVLLSVVLALSGLANLILLIYRRQSNKKPDSSRIMFLNHTTSDLEEGNINNGVAVFSYAQLQQVTNNFDPARELGEGGFGVVYHGKLEDGREVAVKRMYEKNYKQVEQFMNEIHILAQLRHPNLVTLYGSTSRDSHELLLVYEYIPNGTVADHLHGNRSKSSLLLWSTRMKIAIETATALSYLHFKDIIHRDIKTYNILLDRNFCTKVADFGLSRLFPAEVTHVSTAPQGTPGYLDPEYHQCYHLTNKSDVYSFGVVLIELISSLPAIDMERERHEVNLSNYAMNKIQCSAFSELVDPNLGFETSFKVRRMTTLVAELAFQCLQHDRELRPSMAEVMEGLKRIESVDYDALEAEENRFCDG